MIQNVLYKEASIYIDFVKNVYYIMYVIYSTVKLHILINF